MEMLLAEELRRIRETQEAALPDTATIKRNVRQDDGFGGTEVASETIIAEDVPCRVFPAQMEEVLGQLARQLERNTYTVRFPHTTDVRDKDILVLEDGTELKVERVKSPRSWHQLMTVDAERYSA